MVVAGVPVMHASASHQVYLQSSCAMIVCGAYNFSFFWRDSWKDGPPETTFPA
jgi:hypothetical protein